MSLQSNEMEKKVVIIIGHSRAGNTTIAECIERVDPLKYSFLSTGDQLRQQGILPLWNELSLVDFKNIQEKCHELIKAAIETFSADAKTLLVLDAIKSLDDAEYVIEILSKLGLGLPVVVYLNVSMQELKRRLLLRVRYQITPNMVLEELAKWRRLSLYITEYFSQQGAEILYFDCPGAEYFSGSQMYKRDIRIRQLIELLICSDCFVNMHYLFEPAFKTNTQAPMNVTYQGSETDHPVVRCNKGHIVRPGIRPSTLRKLSWEFPWDFSCWKTIPPKSWHAILLGTECTSDVRDSLLRTLKVKRFDFMLPSAFVSSQADVCWIADPHRYFVTHKSDGVRYLFYKMRAGKMYLLNRAKELFRCKLAGSVTHLLDGTILDGELMNQGGSEGQLPVFIAFDILSFGSEKQWHLKLEERQLALENTGIIEEPEIFRNSASFQMEPVGCRGSIKMILARKRHVQSTPQQIRSYMENFDFSEARSVDGLIFTPNLAYTFGSDPFTYKWQPMKQITCDLFAGDGEHKICSAAGDPIYENIYQNTEVIECRWNRETISVFESQNRKKQMEVLSAEPLRVRNDKILPNSKETQEKTKQLVTSPFTEDHVLKALSDFAGIFGSTTCDHILSLDFTSKQVHPSLLVPFAELYESITKEAKKGNVRRTRNESTGLEIYNYYQHAPLDNMTVRMCRGLVIHPSSKSVVTKPFVRFYEDSIGSGELRSVHTIQFLEPIITQIQRG